MSVLVTRTRPSRQCSPEHTLGTVGYIVQKFPTLSETFILNEILALEARGTAIHIFSLDRPNDPRYHESLAGLQAAITYLPHWSNPSWIWTQQVLAAKRFRWDYIRALLGAVRAGPGAWWRFLQSTYIANQVQRLGVHHFHSHYANEAATVASVTSWITGIPYSFTAHAWDIFKTRYTTPRSLRALARKIDRARFVVTVSDFNKAYLARIAPGSSSKIRRLYNGIDLERFVPNGLPPRQPFTLLAVCRLVEKKGLGVLIEACRLLRDRRVAFQGWIVGTGKLHARLAAQIHAARLDQHVKLLGPHTQGEVLARYQAAHLFVLPCLTGADGNREGLPVSLVEALACGLPVVTTPMTGIPEVVRDHHNGLLVAERDSRALADAIEELIRNAALYDRLRTNARASVEALFDLKQTSAQLARFFT